MTALLRLNNTITTLSAWIGGLAVVAMMVHIVADVMFKWVSTSALPFTSVFVANYYMVIIAFLPLAMAENQDRHISVDLAFTHLPKPVARLLIVVVYGLSLVVSAGVAWQMWDEAMKRFGSQTFIVENSISMPIWAGYFILPLGFGLLALLYAIRLVLVLARGLDGMAPLDDHAGGDQRD